MRRNLAPAVTLTKEQRKKIDEAVLAVVRAHGTGIRAGGIEETPLVKVAINGLPSGKDGHRYVGASLQRLRQADMIRLVRGAWRTSRED